MLTKVVLKKKETIKKQSTKNFNHQQRLRKVHELKEIQSKKGTYGNGDGKEIK